MISMTQSRDLATADPASNNFFYKLCGYFIGLPIFAELSSSGISLPQSYYLMEGIPLHTSMISLVLLLPNLRLSKALLGCILLFTIYLLASAFQDLSRSILAIQSIYFLMIYSILRSLNKNQMLEIGHGAIKAFTIFLLLHLSSMVIYSGGSITGLIANSTQFFGLNLYQSHLTYPLVAILVLIMSSHSSKENLFWPKVLFLSVLLLEIIVFRKVAISILLVFLAAYNPRTTFLLGSLALVVVMFNHDW